MMDIEQHIVTYKKRLGKARVAFLFVQVLVICLLAFQAYQNNWTASVVSFVVHTFLTAYIVFLWRKVNKAIDVEQIKSVMES